MRPGRGILVAEQYRKSDHEADLLALHASYAAAAAIRKSATRAEAGRAEQALPDCAGEPSSAVVGLALQRIRQLDGN